MSPSMNEYPCPPPSSIVSIMSSEIPPPPKVSCKDSDHFDMKILNCKLTELQHMMKLFGRPFDMNLAKMYLQKLGYDISIDDLKFNFKYGIFTYIKFY